METWRAKAIEMLPEMGEDANPSDNLMALWIEIHLEFERAYEEPRNEDLIRRIYAYADWCLEHGERSEDAARDAPTCVVVAFYEHIPANPAARLEMPRWFHKDDVRVMKDAFSYHLKPGEFERLLALFPEPHRNKKARKKRRAE